MASADAGPDSPFIRDIPADRALEAWRHACAAGGCPERVPAIRVALADAVGRVTAEAIWARRSSPAFDAAAMDGIAVRSSATVGASETTPLQLTPDGLRRRGHRRPDAPRARRGRHARARAPGAGAWPACSPSCAPPCRRTSTCAPSARTWRPASCCCPRATACAPSTWRRRPRPAPPPCSYDGPPSWRSCRPVTRSGRSGPTCSPGEIPDTNSLMLAAQAREAGCVAFVLPIEPDDPDRIGRAVRAAAADADLVLVVAGSSAGRDDYTARVVAENGTLAVHGVAVRPGHPVVLGLVDRTPVVGCPGYPVSAALTFDVFVAPVLAALEGAAVRRRPVTQALPRPQARLRARHGRLGPGPAGPGGGQRRGDAPLPRGGCAHLAGAGRRSAGRARRDRGPPGRRAGRGRAAARAGRDPADDRGDRVARPGAGPGRLAAARPRPADQPRLVQRGLARRPGGPAGRAVPPRRLAPARPADGRLHPAVRRPAARGP